MPAKFQAKNVAVLRLDQSLRHLNFVKVKSSIKEIERTLINWVTFKNALFIHLFLQLAIPFKKLAIPAIVNLKMSV